MNNKKEKMINDVIEVILDTFNNEEYHAERDFERDILVGVVEDKDEYVIQNTIDALSDNMNNFIRAIIEERGTIND